MFKGVHDKTTDFLKDSIKESYTETAFELQKGIGIGEKMQVPYDERKLENILRTPWASDGKNFSNRIWRDRTQLVNNLQKNLSESVIRGDSDTDMIQALSKDEKKAEFNTRRLVETESAFFDSESERQCCEDFGIEKYRFLAVLDMKTSDICQELDNKVFLEKDRQVGLNAPPMHPFCRSTTAPVIDEEFLTSRRAKNPKTGEYDEIPPEMNYKQWKEKYVEGKENVEPIKQEQEQTDTPNGYEIKLENKNVGYEYKETPLESKTNEFDSNAYENRVKKQAEKNNALIERVENNKDIPKELAEDIKANIRENEKLQKVFRKEVVNIEEKEGISEKLFIDKQKKSQEIVQEPQKIQLPTFKGEKDVTKEYLDDVFGIKTTMFDDLDNETVKGIRNTFEKLNDEIVGIRGSSIKISSIHSVGSMQSLYNNYVDIYLESKLRVEWAAEPNKNGLEEPSEEWKKAILKKNGERWEKKLKKQMCLEKSEDGKGTAGYTLEPSSLWHLPKEFVGIYINSDKIDYEENVKNKWWPPECGNVFAVVSHELGHGLDNLLKISQDKRIKDFYEANYKEYQKYIEASPKKKENMPWNFLSRYAFYYHNDEQRKYREFLAEAVCEHLNSSHSRPIAEAVWDIVKEYVANYKEV